MQNDPLANSNVNAGGDAGRSEPVPQDQSREAGSPLDNLNVPRRTVLRLMASGATALTSDGSGVLGLLAGESLPAAPSPDLALRVIQGLTAFVQAANNLRAADGGVRGDEWTQGFLEGVFFSPPPSNPSREACIESETQRVMENSARVGKAAIALREFEGAIEALRSDGSLSKVGVLIRERCPGISKRAKELLLAQLREIGESAVVKGHEEINREFAKCVQLAEELPGDHPEILMFHRAWIDTALAFTELKNAVSGPELPETLERVYRTFFLEGGSLLKEIVAQEEKEIFMSLGLSDESIGQLRRTLETLELDGRYGFFSLLIKNYLYVVPPLPGGEWSSLDTFLDPDASRTYCERLLGAWSFQPGDAQRYLQRLERLKEGPLLDFDRFDEDGYESVSSEADPEVGDVDSLPTSEVERENGLTLDGRRVIVVPQQLGVMSSGSLAEECVPLLASVGGLRGLSFDIEKTPVVVNTSHKISHLSGVAGALALVRLHGSSSGTMQWYPPLDDQHVTLVGGDVAVIRLQGLEWLTFACPNNSLEDEVAAEAPSAPFEVVLVSQCDPLELGS
jgi:hypothetical protein